MLGTLINTVAVLVGGTLGMFMKKAMPERVTTIYFQAIGLFTLATGISMAVKMEQMLIVVASLAIGGLAGEGLNLESGADKLGNYLKLKMKIGNEKFTEGLIASFLLFCVGAMTITGTIDEGITGSHKILDAKSLMDFFSAMLLASAFGFGVVLSAIPLFIFQGSLTLLAMWASSFFTPAILNGLTSLGGILLIGLGINILEIKKIRVMNLLPALVVVVLLTWIFVKP